MISEKPARPVLRYHGGKWLLAEWIISHFPRHRVYVEPFGGAASVLMQKPRSYAEVYNDLDGEIVNVFRVLRDPVSAIELDRLIRLTPFARDEFRESYQSHSDPIEQARRTILRSFMGFGSAAATGFDTGFRSNSNRSGTTPARDWANLPDRIAEWTTRLQGVVIENKDAAEVMAQHDSKETLFYVDPPYVLSTRKLRNPYCGKGYRFEMTDIEHVTLAQRLHSLSGLVLLAGNASGLYADLYSDWRQLSISVPATGRTREARREVLWFNNAAWKYREGVLKF